MRDYTQEELEVHRRRGTLSLTSMVRQNKMRVNGIICKSQALRSHTDGNMAYIVTAMIP